MNSVSDVCKSYFNGFNDIHCDKKCDAAKNAVGFLKILSYFTLILPAIFALIYACSALVGRVCPERNRKPVDQQIVNLSKKTIGNGNGNIADAVQAAQLAINMQNALMANMQNALLSGMNSLAPAAPKVEPQPTNAPQPKSTPVPPPAATPVQPPKPTPPPAPVLPPRPTKLEEYTDADLEEFFQSKYKCQKLFLIKGKKVGLVYDPSGKAITIKNSFCPPHPIVINSNVDMTNEILQILRSKAPKTHSFGQHIMCVQRYGAKGLPFFEALGFEGNYFEEATAKNFNKTFLTASPLFYEPAKPIVPKTGIDAELEEFFKSTKLCQKRFVVDGVSVAIVFDPTGNKVRLPSVEVKTSWGSMKTGSQSVGPIILLFDKKAAIDSAKRSKIIERIKETCSEEQQESLGQMPVDPELITAYGFDGPTPTQIAPIFTKAFLPPSTSK